MALITRITNSVIGASSKFFKRGTGNVGDIQDKVGQPRVFTSFFAQPDVISIGSDVVNDLADNSFDDPEEHTKKLDAIV